MSDNISDTRRAAITALVRGTALAARGRYDALVADAVRAVDRCARRRLARGTPEPEPFSVAERAWFRSSLREGQP